MITYYSNLQQKWLQRNTTHTVMIEQAAFDRNLFQSTPASEHIDLKFPEYVPRTLPSWVQLPPRKYQGYGEWELELRTLLISQF